MNHWRKGLTTLLCLGSLMACDGNQETDAIPGTVEIPLPGPFGDQFSELVPDPARVDPADVITSYRQHNMRSLSASYRSLELILRYDADYETDLTHHATVLTGSAQRLAGTFEFPAPTAFDQPGARNEIWQQWETFRTHAEELTRAAAGLAAASAGGDQSRDALLAMLNDVRHQCLACHQRFRER